ncbi:MAG: Uma2 family endonuclease [Chloroflexota bacterium]
MSVLVREEPLFKTLLSSPKLFLYQSQIEKVFTTEQEKRAKFYDWMDEDTRAEFINGEIVMHSPAKARHTETSINVSTLLSLFVELNQLGVVHAETTLVSLTRNDYLPDICFFGTAKASQLVPDQMRCPAPDLIVEILSPSTEETDRGIKFVDYAAHGVAEYLLVDPKNRFVEQYTLEAGQYQLRHQGSQGHISSVAVANFTIPIEAMFDRVAKHRVLSSFFTNT